MSKIDQVHLWAVMLCRRSQISSIYTGLGKLKVSAFQNFFQMENPLNIKEVMGKNMFVIFWASFETFDQLFIFITIFDTFNMKVIT